MNIYLTPQQQELIQQQLKSGRFRSVEEVITEALQGLREHLVEIRPGVHDRAVRDMLDFLDKNRVRLDGISVKELIHEGHSV
jgi:putative addiction module CopG family antidote